MSEYDEIRVMVDGKVMKSFDGHDEDRAQAYAAKMLKAHPGASVGIAKL